MIYDGISDVANISGDLSSGMLYGYISADITYKRYAGPYQVSPKKENQVLNVRDLLMTDNLTINGVEYSEVMNPDGTLVVNIGS